MRLPENSGALLRASEVAEILGLDPRTVKAWIRKGILAGDKVDGRWYVKRECPKLQSLLDT